MRKLLLFSVFALWWLAPFTTRAQQRSWLANDVLRAELGDRGLTRLETAGSRSSFGFNSDEFSISIDGKTWRSEDLGRPKIRQQEHRFEYGYEAGGHALTVVYELRPGWRFVSKQIVVTAVPGKNFRAGRIEVVRASLAEAPASVYVHKSRFPRLETRNYGAFLRLAGQRGLLALVQNPFVDVTADRNTFALSYIADMDWSAEYGPFVSDRACLAPYRNSGEPVNLAMIPEWKMASTEPALAIDRAEVETFTAIVRAFLVYKPDKPLRMFVGWCANDYQIDVATPEGRAEYKRMIDRAAELGADHVLYAPTNSALGRREDSTDDWNWENLLWLGLGQKIRKNEWNVEKDPIPPSVAEMLDYARSRNVKLVAYVYPVLPFSQNKEWLVEGTRYHKKKLNASLGVRSFQDWLIQELLAFQKRTGLGGYAFDYTFLWYEGTSRYAQWYGWRRVMEALRTNLPDIAIDGRQLYMQYGPWIWLAGSYPHPTSTDEQPESFAPFPDLHFDRVSANRQRYTTYRYRDYEFCPTEIMPGFIGHQTPRHDDSGEMPMKQQAVAAGGTDRVPQPFRERDWDLLGWRYSLISSIATAGWNNVLNMIPSRDISESRAFSEADKQFLRKWLDWADRNKEILRYTRTIGPEPAIGRVDGTAAFEGDRGFVFLFNPNGRKLDAEIFLDQRIGLVSKGKYSVREVYPMEGRLLGKPVSGFWSFGDRVTLPMDGTSAIVLEVKPAPASVNSPLLFNVPGEGRVEAGVLKLTGVKGEPGSESKALVLVSRGVSVQEVLVNGSKTTFQREGNIVTVPLRFKGARFAHSQQIGAYDSQFASGVVSGSFQVPARVFEQLRNRRKMWPIEWTPEDLRTTWLAPERLLLFVQIAEPDDRMHAELKLNGEVVPLTKAYSAVRPHRPTFVGFYADVSNLTADRDYRVELTLPTLKPGQFQGLFFDNVETEYTEFVMPAGAIQAGRQGQIHHGEVQPIHGR